MPKISVIVPVYNVEKYLSTCLESLLKQTLSDIEIICVDDKSPDNALSILYDYANKDSRVNVIELPENGGVARARNTGIDAATGEYISFVDPDDYVDLDYFEKLYKTANKTNADICMPRIIKYESNGTVFGNDNLLKNVKKSKYYFTYFQCASIYKTNFLKQNQLYCPVGVTNGEDIMFCIKAAILCNTVVCVPDTSYHYVRRDDSAEGLFYTEKQINSRIQVAKNINQIINDLSIDEKAYKILFLRAFEILSVKNILKTPVKKLHMQSVQAIMELYQSCKQPTMFRNNPLYPYMECNDAEGFYEMLCKVHNAKKIIRINLLKKIPFIKIDQNIQRKKIKLFGITILYVKYEE